MNKTYEFIAKTADEAIDKALLELNCSLSDLDIDILEHKASGLFGFLKPKEIKIVAKFKEEYLKQKQSELSKAAPKTPTTTQAKPVVKAEKKEETISQKQEKMQKPEVKKSEKPQAKSETKPEVKVEAKAEVKPETKPEAKPEVKLQKPERPEKQEKQEKQEKLEKPEAAQPKFEEKPVTNVKDHNESVEMDFEEDDRNNRKSVEITDLTEEERTKIKDLAYEFVMDLLDSMKIDAEITLIEKRQQLLVLLNIKEGKQLIGYRGETLFAIQYLLSVYMNYKMDKYLRIKLDINNYRKKKEMELKRRVMSVAKKVEKTNRPIKLEEMHASDRHFIHMQLKRNKKVYTKSEGVEPNRCVVILPAQHQ